MNWRVLYMLDHVFNWSTISNRQTAPIFLGENVTNQNTKIKYTQFLSDTETLQHFSSSRLRSDLSFTEQQHFQPTLVGHYGFLLTRSLRCSGDGVIWAHRSESRRHEEEGCDDKDDEDEDVKSRQMLEQLAAFTAVREWKLVGEREREREYRSNRNIEGRLTNLMDKLEKRIYFCLNVALKLDVGGTEADIISKFRVSQLSVWFVPRLFDNDCIEQDGIAPHHPHWSIFCEKCQ